MPSSNITVLETSHISPPLGSVPETSLPYTYLDVTFLYIGYVDRIFFYPFPHSTHHFIHNILPNFKSSLSKALQRFFPLAGKIRPTPGTKDRYEIHYADGDFVVLTVGEHVEGFAFDELSKSHPRDINRLLVLQPELKQSGDTWPALAIQVTVFPGHGLTVAVSVHHGVCDGSSSMRFVSSWALACRTGSFASEPMLVFDRTSITDPHGLYEVYLTAIRRIISSFDENAMKTFAAKQLVSATFTLTSKHIDKLKKRATTKAINDGDASFRCSTIVATYAYVWCCLVKARRYPDEQMACMGFVADCRSLLQPPLSSTYFGNGLISCIAERIKSVELFRDDGFETAAKVIAKAIKELKEDPMKVAETMFDKNMDPLHTLTVAGSPKFGVYDVDFGWGRPVKVEMTSAVKTGAMAMAKSRDDEGGVEIGLALAKDVMDEFAAQFSNGLYDS